MPRVKDVYIIDGVRTPFGKFFGALKDIAATELGTVAVRAMLSRLHLNPNAVEELYAGQVLTAGVGQNPARQVAIGSGLDLGCDAETVNKVCASSLAAIQNAGRAIRLGEADLVIAGGMESMSRAPYSLTRWEKAVGNKQIVDFVSGASRQDTTFVDTMLSDGLCDIYDLNMAQMGLLADICASAEGISREEQEDYAEASFLRAIYAHRRGAMSCQITRVPLIDKMMESDEGIRMPDREKMRKLSPYFREDGTITAATSAQISDGAAMLLLCSERMKSILGIQPLARVIGWTTFSHEPSKFATAPVGAICNLLSQHDLSLDQIALFEINEAFAVVPIYAMRELGIPHDKVNIWGGAIALGHPLGASGARIVMNLTYQLKETGGKYGIAVACFGGGGAMAVLIENPHSKSSRVP